MDLATASAPLALRPDLAAVQERFLAWWDHRGLLVGTWDPPGDPGRSGGDPGPPAEPDRAAWHCQADTRAWRCAAALERSWFGLDILPVADGLLGPGSLALHLGCEPDFRADTIWFSAPWKGATEPERLPRLGFDPGERWWLLQERILAAMVARGEGRFLTGIPDLMEGLDVLASLRDGEDLLADLIDRPEWVAAKTAEIDAAWRACFERLHRLTATADGWSVFSAFRVYGPGRVAKVQCDFSAMIGPRMFRRFVLPGIAAQCAWLDRSMYHVDGSKALVHLDALLGLADLDAIEWTPDPGLPQGGDLHWAPLYRRIKAAGKSVQAVGVALDQVVPLLEAVGPEGMYLLVDIPTRREGEELARRIARFRA